MSLRDHLHQWLHPRDPLLEAWKDDPFVEMMATWSGRLPFGGGRWLRENYRLIPHFLATLALLGLLVYFVVQGDDSIVDKRYLLGAFLLATGYLANKAKDVQSRSRPDAFMHDTAGFHSRLVDLWLCGARGRDIAKVVYLFKGSRASYGGGTVIVFPILVCLCFVAGWIITGRSPGAALITSFVLLLSWMACAVWRLLVTHNNPYQEMDDLPRFLSPLKTLDDNRIGSSTEIIAISFIVLLVAIVLVVFAWFGGRGLAFFPYGFVVFAIAVAIANYLVLSAPIETADTLLGKMEEVFPEVDEQFNLYVRNRLVQDPDADRQS